MLSLRSPITISASACQQPGEEHIRKKVAEARARREASSATAAPPMPPAAAPAVEPEPEVFEKVLAALVRSGFKRPEARRAVEQVGMRGVDPRPEPVLRAALTVLTP
jgi:Holliday junction resolvasome RuvABC DNA-binding subunit